MHYEHHEWHSPRMGQTMGIAIYGHYGRPMLVFPTSSGHEHEYEGMGMIPALAHHIEAGRVKFYCVDSGNRDGWGNKDAHPGHRAWMQVQYDAYIAEEVAPFIRWHCQSPGIAIAVSGSSMGGYHAANSTLKHPELFRQCFAMSGIYDARKLVEGHFDDNVYFNSPVDYVSNMHDRWTLEQLAGCDIHLITGNGPWEDSSHSYQLSDVLRARGIPHRVDDWGAEGGHDWPYWKRQMNYYIERMF